MNNKVVRFLLTVIMLNIIVCACSGCGEEAETVMVYAPDGRAAEVNASELDKWTGDNWYLSPVKTLYAPDGRTICVEQSEVSKWTDVGWYEYPVANLYSDNGVIVVSESEFLEYKNVGWREPHEFFCGKTKQWCDSAYNNLEYFCYYDGGEFYSSPDLKFMLGFHYRTHTSPHSPCVSIIGQVKDVFRFLAVKSRNNILDVDTINSYFGQNTEPFYSAVDENYSLNYTITSSYTGLEYEIYFYCINENGFVDPESNLTVICKQLLE